MVNTTSIRSTSSAAGYTGHPIGSPSAGTRLLIELWRTQKRLDELSERVERLQRAPLPGGDRWQDVLER